MPFPHKDRYESDQKEFFHEKEKMVEPSLQEVTTRRKMKKRKRSSLAGMETVVVEMQEGLGQDFQGPHNHPQP